MKSVLLGKCRQEYIKLNRQFLEKVESGTSWEELQVLIDEMKSLAIYLQQIPTSVDVANPLASEAAGEAAGMEPVV